MLIETQRLILKLTEQADFNNIVILRSDPEVMRYTSQARVQTKEEVQKFLETAIPYQEKYGHGICSVFDKFSGKFIGQAGLLHTGFFDENDIEISCRLHKEFWGKGYATELIKALIQWGFTHLSVKKLIAFVYPENLGSHRALKKCGMIHLGLVECYYGILEKYEIYKQEETI